MAGGEHTQTQPTLGPQTHQAAEQHKVHWSYEAPAGPEHWGDLKPAYAACVAGTQQSPINFETVRPAALTAPQIHWQAFEGEIVNNGHTIQVNVAPGSTMVLEGKTYQLLQFHFHHVSEHTVDGKHYPLEAHFVHQAEDGTLGVLGVFFEQGAGNPMLGQIWSLAPTAEGEADETLAVDPMALLPRASKFYRYQGSLTTPPCSEIVDWVVYQQPLQASAEQIEAFASVFEANYRPTQPLNRRYVLSSQ